MEGDLASRFGADRFLRLDSGGNMPWNPSDPANLVAFQAHKDSLDGAPTGLPGLVLSFDSKFMAAAMASTTVVAVFGDGEPSEPKDTKDSEPKDTKDSEPKDAKPRPEPKELTEPAPTGRELEALKESFGRGLKKLGWPNKAINTYVDSVPAGELKAAIRGLESKEPRAMFFGTYEPFDPKKFGSLDEVSNAATALDIHASNEGGFVNIIESVPASAISSRFKSGDTEFFEQSYFLDRRKLSGEPVIHCVPKAEFAKLLREHCADDIVRLRDPRTGRDFDTVKPGREVEVGRKIVEAWKAKVAAEAANKAAPALDAKPRSEHRTSELLEDAMGGRAEPSPAEVGEKIVQDLLRRVQSKNIELTADEQKALREEIARKKEQLAKLQLDPKTSAEAARLKTAISDLEVFERGHNAPVGSRDHIAAIDVMTRRLAELKGEKLQAFGEAVHGNKLKGKGAAAVLLCSCALILLGSGANEYLKEQGPPPLGGFRRRQIAFSQGSKRLAELAPFICRVDRESFGPNQRFWDSSH